MKLSIRCVIAVVVLGVFLFPAATAQSGRGWMDGFVVLESATAPAADATIELTSLTPRSDSGKLTEKTDKRGEYKFKQIPYGDYKLRVTSDGYRPYEIDIYIMPDVQTRIHVRLKKK